MFLFAEKPAVAPSVFVFQKDKGQKVRDHCALYTPSSDLLCPLRSQRRLG